MDTRRIQVTQGESYMITLPKEWAGSMGLKKNDSVNVEVQSNGDLLIAPVRKVDASKDIKRINVSDVQSDASLYRRLVGAYISGHNTIEVASDTGIKNNVAEVASSFTQTSIGLEIVEEDSRRILIKDLMDHTEIKPSKSIERMSLLVGKMIGDVFESALTGDISNLSDIEKRDVEVDRIHWLISRQSSIYKKNPWLCKKADSDLSELTKHLAVSRIVERIGDHAVLVSKNLTVLIGENKAQAVDKSLREFGKDILNLYENSMRSWLRTDMDAAEGCIESGEKMVKKIEKTFKKTEVDVETASATSLIAWSSRRIAEYCIDISELTINAAMD